MLATSLVALDSTIIATAVPSVVRSLGGFSEFPWLFSIYLLAQAVSVPIYAKVADMFGRKPVILLGIALFLVGSILCGVAWSMPALIAFRALQGLGAGAVQPMSITIVGDLYSLEERAKVQGYLASVWGIASVVGPTLGGVFSEWVSWRWIFFVNIPMCFLAGWMLLRKFNETVTRKPHRIDYLGSVLLTVGCSLLILGLLEGGQSWAWNSPAGIGIFVVGVLALVGFVQVERRAAEPVLPLWIFRRRVLVGGSAVSLSVGAVLLGLTSYIPTYVQTVLGAGPLVAGFALATLTIGWPIAASFSGRLYLRIGFRWTAVIGGLIALTGTSLTLLLGRDSSIVTVGVFCFIVGLGMGLVASPTLVAAQSSVGWSDRAVVTGTNMFSRSIGSAVGVALFGAIANAVLNASGSPDQSATAINTASHHVFIAVVVICAAMAAAALMLPRRSEQVVV
ncbi:MDR family MFS transporter [Nakamurella sp. PAMC28650]|uniref:MDR family MFS transporter n=1 Tax=Nakamurella sp. PAMC28650 TaxID=2762325 RepID=UPI00164DB14D|nr:MFS transporter [Nakamurella sp. PAMC28650]